MTTETERWHRIWGHREQLLKVARRRSMCVEDAEDAVHEAMVRASERPYLDDDRLGAWLTTVTIRLCADRYRQVNRDADARGHTAHTGYTVAIPAEEVVCDRAEARWLARRSCELPPRQAEALWLKAEDLDVGQIAQKMGLNYRTTESLLARARRTLRRTLAGTLAVLGWLTGYLRPRTGGSGVHAVGAVSTAVTLAVLSFTVPPSSVPGGAGDSAGAPKPVSSVDQQADERAAELRGGGESGAAPRPVGSAPAGEGEAPSAAGIGLGEPLKLPDMPDVPGIANDVLPPATLPDAPKVPELPEVPDTRDAPDLGRLTGSSQGPVPDAPLPTVPDDLRGDAGDLP